MIYNIQNDMRKPTLAPVLIQDIYMTSILNEREGPLAVLTLNRPAKRNAMSLTLMNELIAALEAAGSDRSVQAVILAASGPVFSSGHDLSEMTCRPEGEYRELFKVCTKLMTTIQSIPQPVIAQVQGPATAAGCQLVATCDLAIAADTAWFATPGVKIGLFCSTPMVALTRAIGRKQAMRMLLTGAPVNAAQAAEWGLINEAVPALELEQRTRELAAAICQASSFTVALGKQTFYTQIDLDQAGAYEFAADVMTRNAMAVDAQEGIGAFLEKRAASWKGR